jgi:DNA repair protein RecO (recombination protein O)
VADIQRAEAEASFVLHTYPYSETSLIADVFSRRHGRIALLARGARRPRSNVRGLLIGFQPLAISWSGKGEVRTLVRAEWLGGVPLLAGNALLCGFYLNELLIRTLAREDAHEALFEAYARAIESLAAGDALAPALRRFEKALLKELGYAMPLERDAASGSPIEPDANYTYDPERGPVRLPAGAAADVADIEIVVRGQALLDLAGDDYTDPDTLQQVKHLMRVLINHRLDTRPLLSRQVLRDLQQL